MSLVEGFSLPCVMFRCLFPIVSIVPNQASGNMDLLKVSDNPGVGRPPSLCKALRRHDLRWAPSFVQFE